MSRRRPTSRADILARATAPLALASVIGLGLAGCVPTPAPEPSGSSAPPTASPSETSTPTAAPPESEEVELYFAVSHPTDIDLIPETHELEVEPDGDVLAVALAAITEGAVAPTDPDYANLWRDVRLRGIERDGDVLRVDLGGLLQGVGSEAEFVAIEQLVWTATGIEPGIRALTFTVDGDVVETLGGHVDAQGEFARGLPESTLSPLQIDAPAEGATVMSPLRASGVACVFEATFGWELLQNGMVLEEGFAMSDESCPARAPWSLDLGPRPEGEYTLVITEYSMKDGSVASTDTKTFTVSGT
ncbi:MAG: Gmad2 immunoglobulin-like domain-containing protein [Microcella sp.]|uniref:Gmad2 immunoglobulin-like domain-containing protein n=1 Tax=Microcella sp. TaxID=1913979 RepID=UPI002717D61F|nr:Gmad2 immunoglobulin-like domain-containing protein [Microcella sp.]MDO8337493.1 Gmad2 immunoglobulin-like domain-containing protein [Microcella sp.]